MANDKKIPIIDMRPTMPMVLMIVGIYLPLKWQPWLLGN